MGVEFSPIPSILDLVPNLEAVSIYSHSHDTAPSSMGLPYDTSSACLLRGKELHKLADQGPWLPLFDAAHRALRGAGCAAIPECHPFSTWCTTPNICFQMCSPSIEYPLSGMCPRLRFLQPANCADYASSRGPGRYTHDCDAWTTGHHAGRRH